MKLVQFFRRLSRKIRIWWNSPVNALKELKLIHWGIATDMKKNTTLKNKEEIRGSVDGYINEVIASKMGHCGV